MPPNNYDPAPTPVERLDDAVCPKCGAVTEPIEAGVDGPPVRHLQLCPACYLVTWIEEDGLHVRQGVPVEKNASSSFDPDSFIGKPEEC